MDHKWAYTLVSPAWALCVSLAACSFDGGTPGRVVGSGSTDASVSTSDGGTEEPTECTSLSEGEACSSGVCLSGSCRSDLPVELPVGSLSFHDTDSTTATADNSLDDNRLTRWTSDPDTLPRYISYRLDQPYYVAGVRVDSGDWSHCGQSAVSVSMDGITWQPPVATYTEVSPLPNNMADMFSAATLAEFIRIDVKARTDGGRYCYIGEFRVVAIGL